MQFIHNLENSFPKSFFVSAGVHILVLAISVITWPTLFRALPPEQDSITFEIVSISEINNVKPKQKESLKPHRAVQNSRLMVKATQNEAKLEIKEAQKSSGSTRSPSNAASPAPQQSASEAKILQKQTAQQKTQNQKTRKKGDSTREATDPLDDIMKSLEESHGDDKGGKIARVPSKMGENKRLFRNDEFKHNLPISITEKNLIRRTIESNWHKPSMLPINNGIKISFELEFETDGAIKKYQHLKTICNHSAQTCTMALDSVIRAIKKTKVIEGLPAERHRLWKIVQLNFDLEL